MGSRLSLALTVVLGLGGLASASPAAAQATPPVATRDGSHDFDFNVGVWHTRITRTPNPFDAPATKFEMSGTVHVRKIWNGKGALEEIEADGPKGHWEGLTLFLYNPEAHQWSQTFANSADGTLQPATIGSFSNGRGELYSQDTFKGRSILVRGTWTIINANEHRYEEAYSRDGGRSWAVAFSGQLTRIAAETQPPATP